ncbi:MAG: hypothetical protein AVO39_06360 [delta proteobacterium MLS_D]|nr:MAG: hypothetical protein AVO39_06360 [delta proteobacterium MLS_D]
MPLVLHDPYQKGDIPGKRRGPCLPAFPFENMTRPETEIIVERKKAKTALSEIVLIILTRYHLSKCIRLSTKLSNRTVSIRRTVAEDLPPKSAIGSACSRYRQFNTPFVRRDMCCPMHIQTKP